MVSMKILDVKSFMSELLVYEMFDSFLLSKFEVDTFIHFQISGELNTEFYSTDEKELLQERKYSFWKEVKPMAFSLIKGTKLPLSMKIVFMLPANHIQTFIKQSKIDMNYSNINGLYLNIKYEKGELFYTTGTSIKVFSLDKSLDILWDEKVNSFFRQKGITICN